MLAIPAGAIAIYLQIVAGSDLLHGWQAKTECRSLSGQLNPDELRCQIIGYDGGIPTHVYIQVTDDLVGESSRGV